MFRVRPLSTIRSARHLHSLTNLLRNLSQRASNFDQPLDWIVSSVTDMNTMFSYAGSFNQPLDWDVAQVRQSYSPTS